MATKCKGNAYSTYRVPTGYLLINSRLAKSEIHDILKDKFQITIDSTLGPIDIMYLDGKGVLYIDENELTNIEEYKKRVTKFKTVNQGMVMLESTTFDENVMEFQNFVVIEMKLSMLIVVSKSEAVDLLGKIIKEELNPRNNPFLIKQKPISNENCILNALLNIPKLGTVKAKSLMENFKTLEGLVNASEEELVCAVGKASARILYNFLHSEDSN